MLLDVSQTVSQSLPPRQVLGCRCQRRLPTGNLVKLRADRVQGSSFYCVQEVFQWLNLESPSSHCGDFFEFLSTVEVLVQLV